jgi:transcriptional regulator with XRE-family HTH domain
MDIKRYNHISELFDALVKEARISASEIANKLDCSHAYISMIRKGNKVPSVSILERLCNLFQLSLDQCIELRERSEQKGKPESNNSKPNEVNVKQEVSVLGYNEKPAIPDNTIGELQEVISELFILSDELQLQVATGLRELIDSIQYNTVKKFNHRDIKSVLTNTYDKWKRTSKTPGYQPEPAEVFEEYLEGHLELSNSSLFFTLTCNNQYLKVTTRYQDRNLMEEFLNLSPGLRMSLFDNGNLGKTYKNTALCHTFIVNPASLVKETKVVLQNNNVEFNKVTFEDCSIEPYFRYV